MFRVTALRSQGRSTYLELEDLCDKLAKSVSRSFQASDYTPWVESPFVTAANAKNLTSDRFTGGCIVSWR